jgi:hypothetical protein
MQCSADTLLFRGIHLAVISIVYRSIRNDEATLLLIFIYFVIHLRTVNSFELSFGYTYFYVFPFFRFDPKAFLFSLVNPWNRPPSKHLLYKNLTNAVYHEATSGPTWGGGFDLFINLSRREISYLNLGYSYDPGQEKPPGLTTMNYYFTGTYSNWSIIDVEVYASSQRFRRTKFSLLRHLISLVQVVFFFPITI